MCSKNTMGIDIGTTTISIVMTEKETGRLIGSYSIPHHGFIKGRLAFQRLQDPEKLLTLAARGAGEMIKKYGQPDCIGMTGQMHGILYVDEKGEAVTPFYTWQDGSGDELAGNDLMTFSCGKSADLCRDHGKREKLTYARLLKASTGMAATGYGMTTHFFLQKNGKIPKEARKMVTISDYIAMKLCGERTPYVAVDMAASWGCFDLEKKDFYREELVKLGMDLDYLPEIKKKHTVMGITAENREFGIPAGIPVIASRGDNQASFLGAVKDTGSSVLINIGTGSQVSMGTAFYVKGTGNIEPRPCRENLFLMAGSSLCGGRAYAMLEGFYREIAGDRDDFDRYKVMEDQARDFIHKYGREAAWDICTAFSGTRNNPQERGRISGISVDNFHPGAMTVGIIQGILNELYEMYQEMCRVTGKRAQRLVGSGNGLRKNPLMQELAQEIFQMPLTISPYEEEAAYGAAQTAGDTHSLRRMP